MLNLINPFSKRDKPDTSFFDRVGIGVLALFCVLMSILLPFYAWEWLKHATWMGRIKFVMFFAFVVLFGERFAMLMYWLNESAGFKGWAVSMCISLFCIYWFCIFCRGFYRWFMLKVKSRE